MKRFDIDDLIALVSFTQMRNYHTYLSHRRKKLTQLEKAY
jgi:hypothetical protein